MAGYIFAKVYHLLLVLSIAYGSNNVSTTTETHTTVTPPEGAGETVNIESYKIHLCSPSPVTGYGLRLRTFTVAATDDGDVDISGTLIVKTKVTSPLRATVHLQKKFLGVYITIPCMNNIGSCSYEDLCEYDFSTDECSPTQEEMKFPCGCPIKPGEYNNPMIKLREKARTNWPSLVQGEYIGNIKIYQGDTVLTCYDIKFTLT